MTMRALIPRVTACRTAKPRIAKAMSRLAANTPDSRPGRSGRNEPAIAAASSAELDAGNAKVARSGHGRFSRPEIFTTRAASQRLNTLVIVGKTAPARGTAHTHTSDS